MHSIFSISARRTSIPRPATPSMSRASAGKSAGSTLTRWLGATSAIWSSQNAVMAVSTRPLSGTGSGITTSKAEMRSEATISRWRSSTS